MPPGRQKSLPRSSVWSVFILSLSTVGLVCYNTAYWGVHGPIFDFSSADCSYGKFGQERAIQTSIQLTPSLRPLQELIDAIREATRLAAGGSEPAAFTGQERKEWDLANPCRSRLGLKSMYARRKVATDVDGNVLWDMVLREYSILHRVCRQKVGNVKDYFLARNSSIGGCKFAIADFSEGGGLGNKILAVANTVLYAILTQRVVLVPAATLVPALMCEPFPGSSWVLEQGINDGFPIPPWYNAYKKMWTFHNAVYEELDRAENGNVNKSPSTIYSSSMSLYQYQPDSRFFCDDEQASLTGVTWLYMTGCLYTIPRFFALPVFRQALEVLFPERLVLTHMLRSLMLPEDLVWERILRTDAANWASADRRVGVQIRYRRNLEEYQQMNDIINQRIMKCAVDSKVLPQAVDYNATADCELDVNHDPRASPVVKVLVASLFTGFSDMLQQRYLSRSTSTREIVGLIQLSHESKQSYGLDVDRQSLVEIMMLSFSDALFVTPLSTFGGLAQSYGNLVPWILDFRQGEQFGPCDRGQTVDLCYQEADFNYSCPHDPDLDGKTISDVVPYIRNCLAVDSQVGIRPGFQLITSNV